MKRTDFFFELPQELIAQYPAKNRGDSRLLVLNRETGLIEHTLISNLKKHIPDNSLLVFNNSKVRKARVFAKSLTGGNIEIIFIRPLIDEHKPGTLWEVIMYKAKKHIVGKELILPGNREVVVEKVEEGTATRYLRSATPLDETYFDEYGHMPLPPYIKREDNSEDDDRYQTIYSRETGSVAAPTAGLHFTKELLDSLTDEKRKIETAEVTLHVGLGTFLPVRAETIFEHKMHREEYYISDETSKKVNLARLQGKNIIAIGTTSVRTLESAFDGEKVPSGYGDTSIFIYPGYEFKVVNRLFTNFHTPESTLLMLVSAFATRDKIFEAYNTAIEEKYRFFSYGDAMLIL